MIKCKACPGVQLQGSPLAVGVGSLAVCFGNEKVKAAETLLLNASSLGSTVLCTPNWS